MVVIMVIIDVIIVGLVVGIGRDHDLTVRRSETVKVIYAADAGVQMSIREMMQIADEDGDGTIGTISDDSNDANDPSAGDARFVVTATADTPFAGQTTLTSTGRYGTSIRSISTVLE